MKRSGLFLVGALTVVALLVVSISGCNIPLGVSEITVSGIRGTVRIPSVDDSSDVLIVIERVTDGMTASVAKALEPEGSASSKAVTEGLYSLYTDENGCYQLLDLPEGEYTLTASKANTQGAVYKSISVEPKSVTVVDIVLTATGSVTGTVTLDGNSTGMVGTFIFAEGTSYIAAANDAGAFRIDNIPIGSYTIAFYHEGYTTATTTVTVIAGNSTDVGQSNLSPAALDILRTLTTTATVGGICTPTASKVVVRGMPTDIVATPEVGYSFVNWTVTNGTALFGNSNLPQTTVILDSTDAEIQANFIKNWYTLTTWASPNDGWGTCTPNTPQTVEHGVPTLISATVSSPYVRFNGWKVVNGTATFKDAAALTTEVTLTSGDATIKADFVEWVYTIEFRVWEGIEDYFAKDNYLPGYIKKFSFDMIDPITRRPLTEPLEMWIGVLVKEGYHFDRWCLNPPYIEDPYSQFTRIYLAEPWIGISMTLEAAVWEDRF